ncbi:glycosyltransferase family 2 protein [Pelagibacterales bacterium SAG-MED39]|nr:glycosyltransferase family 2 protein [Pelagibacterales bacterium SAG-MED39]
MNNKIKISVLVSNYNKVNFLKESLLMLKKQSYKNFEVILFDDVSDDGSLEIIKKFRNVKLLINKKKKFRFPALNQINALNECFKISKGEIICLLDADDFFKKNKLQKVINFFEKHQKAQSVYNFPKAKKNKFRFKNKRKNIWPSIFPTSCISSKRKNFEVFLKFVKKRQFPNLEIDARFTIFSKFYNNEYNFILDELTIYNEDRDGITSKISKYSTKWWFRRRQAFQYMEYILNLKKRKLSFSFDHSITHLTSSLLKFNN